MAFVGADHAIGDHQRRGDAWRLGAVQRRVQRSRRGRRHRRVDFRRCPSLEPAPGSARSRRQQPRNDVRNRATAETRSRVDGRRSLVRRCLYLSLRGSRRRRAGPAVRQPASPPAAGPYPSDGIAAVVDDQVISVDDLTSRMKMVMLSTNIGNSPESRARLANQVLRAMIDEKLRNRGGQTAERHDHRRRGRQGGRLDRQAKQPDRGAARRCPQIARRRSQRPHRSAEGLDRMGEIGAAAGRGYQPDLRRGSRRRAEAAEGRPSTSRGPGSPKSFSSSTIRSRTKGSGRPRCG